MPDHHLRWSSGDSAKAALPSPGLQHADWLLANVIQLARERQMKKDAEVLVATGGLEGCGADGAERQPQPSIAALWGAVLLGSERARGTWTGEGGKNLCQAAGQGPQILL
jgi:hypothetical protein